MKRLNTFALMVGVFVLGLCFSASTAFASDGLFEINIQGALDSVVTIVFTVLGAFAVWAVAKLSNIFTQKFGVEIEDSMRQYVNEAIINGLHYARDKVSDKTKTIDNPEIKNEVVATAANYVLDKVPDAISYFGLDDEEKLKELILSRLPQIMKS